MRTTSSPWAVCLTAAVLALGGCASPDAQDTPVPPAAEGADDGAGANGGASGGCASVPSGNVDGGYPAENLPAVQERTNQLVEVFEAAEGRYCIDGGIITYFLVYDFAADGFHGLDVCGSVFTYFEGDFENATLVYTDVESPCG